jgi:hypothetical protein
MIKALGFRHFRLLFPTEHGIDIVVKSNGFFIFYDSTIGNFDTDSKKSVSELQFKPLPLLKGPEKGLFDFIQDELIQTPFQDVSPNYKVVALSHGMIIPRQVAPMVIDKVEIYCNTLASLHHFQKILNNEPRILQSKYDHAKLKTLFASPLLRVGIIGSLTGILAFW